MLACLLVVLAAFAACIKLATVKQAHMWPRTNPHIMNCTCAYQEIRICEKTSSVLVAVICVLVENVVSIEACRLEIRSQDDAYEIVGWIGVTNHTSIYIYICIYRDTYIYIPIYTEREGHTSIVIVS